MPRMYAILPESEGHIVALKAIGKLTSSDFVAFQPVAEELFEKAAPARVLLDWSELEGWDAEGEKRSFRFWLAGWKLIERLAIVCDDHLLSDVARLKETLSHAEVRHFAVDQRDRALAWLREN